MKRPGIALIASLILNVFLLGLVGGTLWYWSHNGDMGFRNGWRQRVMESLTEPQAKAMRQAIHATFQEEMPSLRAGRAARAEAARLFVQPQIDTAQINAKLDQARASDMALRTRLEHRMIEFAATLPQDRRKKMAEALKDGPFRQGPPRGHGMNGPPPGPPPQ